MADKVAMEDFSKMKVTELKKVLKERGLSVSGTKSELLERLTVAASADATVDSSAIDDAVLDDSTEVKETQPAKKVIEKVTVEAPAADTSADKETESNDSTPATKVSTTTLSAAEKMKQRAERFGVINEDIKKQLRAERFGGGTGGSNKLSTAGTGADVDVLKKRAERFGQVLSSSLSKVDEAERLKKRKDRFGDVTASTNNAPSKFAKISFNTSSEEEEKKKKRAERFGKA